MTDTETRPEHREQTTEDEVLSEFIKVMQDWGHYKTAACLRMPTREEAFRKLRAPAQFGGSAYALMAREAGFGEVDLG